MAQSIMTFIQQLVATKHFETSHFCFLCCSFVCIYIKSQQHHLNKTDPLNYVAQVNSFKAQETVTCLNQYSSTGRSQLLQPE